MAADEGAATSFTAADSAFMLQALAEARQAQQQREVPVGCVIVQDGKVIAGGHNMTNAKRNGTRHAEFEAIDKVLAACGGDVQTAGFDRCVLYVTVEPCIMCAGALSQLHFKEVIYGAGNDRFGGCGSILCVHEDGCGACGSTTQDIGLAGASEAGHACMSPGYGVRGGLYAEEAITLLQDFYAAGNPAAPKPHRLVRAAIS